MKAPTAYWAGSLCLVAGYLSHMSGLDLFIAKIIYTHFDGFPRNAFFLKNVMHEGMRSANIVALSSLALLALWDYFRPLHWLASKHLHLRVFLVCATVFIGGIAALKSFTTPACPWDFAQFGGDKQPLPYSDIFNVSAFGQGHCFPAGHSTSGYVWMAFAFLFSQSAHSFRRSVFFLLPIGLSLSAAQIIRGAHFLSHELTTLGIGLIVFSAVPPLFFCQPDDQSKDATNVAQN